MTPKNEVVMIDVNAPILENIAKIKESKYTRFPVYKDNKNKILGVLNVKDLIMQHRNKDGTINLREIIRPIQRISATDKIDDVFRAMQEKRESISLVYDKDKFLGIVTLEDAIEEIVGNIYDEYDG